MNEKNETRQSKRIQNYTSEKKEIDKAYFNSYSNPNIHEEMINDKIRMNTYETAINLISKDKVIIDIGAGTGILSMMAAKAGANKIFAIEKSDIIQTAIQTIKDNGLQNKISFLKARAEEAILPIKQVDLIISEWMGYALLYENMLPSVIHVRDNYLKEGGSIIPKRALLYIAAIHKEVKQNGFILSSVNKRKIEQARIDIVQDNQIMTNNFPVIDIDLEICSSQCNDFISEFELTTKGQGFINGFVLWFETYLTDEIILSTCPGMPETHWKHTILMLDKNIQINIGDNITGSMQLSFQKANYRALDFKLKFKGSSMSKEKIYNYSLD